MQKVKGREKCVVDLVTPKRMFPAAVTVLCFTFSLLLWNDGWRVGEGLTDLAVCSGVGC